MEKYRFLIWAMTVLTAVALSVSGCDRFGSGAAQKQVQKVTLGLGSGLVLSPVLIAVEKGYFREAGLDLTLKKFNSGKVAFQNMLQGGVDISTVSLAPVMFTSFSRQDYGFFATFTESYHNIKVIAKKDRGINTARDLVGKRVGTPAGTSAHFMLASFLMQYGLSDTDLQVVDLKPLALADALLNNEVDAIVVWEPFAYKVRTALADKAIRMPSSEVYNESFNFLVMKTFAAEHPEVLQKILRAIDKACDFIRQHEKESLAIIVKRLDLDRDFAAAVWDEYRFNLSLSQSLLLTMEEQARWAMDSGLVDQTTMPNYFDFALMDAMKEVKPEAVTIIH